MADNLLDQAAEQFPILKDHDIAYKENFGGGEGYMEAWSPGMTEGNPGQMRPSEFPMDKFGVEVYNKDSHPEDVMADITSHHLINVDPVVKDTYSKFTNSLEPFQHDILKDQYEWAQKNQNEQRPYDDWRDNTGLPGYLRGYTFNQWPKDFNDKAYTPEQTKMLDTLKNYLQSNKGIKGK